MHIKIDSMCLISDITGLFVYCFSKCQTYGAAVLINNFKNTVGSVNAVYSFIFHQYWSHLPEHVESTARFLTESLGQSEGKVDHEFVKWHVSFRGEVIGVQGGNDHHQALGHQLKKASCDQSCVLGVLISAKKNNKKKTCWKKVESQMIPWSWRDPPWAGKRASRSGPAGRWSCRPYRTRQSPHPRWSSFRASWRGQSLDRGRASGRSMSWSEGSSWTSCKRGTQWWDSSYSRSCD